MSAKIEIQNLPEELRRKGVGEKLAEICRRNDIVFMAIFGSFARGEQSRKSDIDIAIEFDRNSEKSLLDLVRTENVLRARASFTKRDKAYLRRILDAISNIERFVEDLSKEEFPARANALRYPPDISS